MARSTALLALLLLAAAATHITVVSAFLPPPAMPSGTATATRAASSLVTMGASSSSNMDRRAQLQRVALAGLGIVMAPAMPALADSTGKYSTKQTAKKRYLPRVRKGVAQFAALESALDKPEARAAYAQLVDDNVGAALSLYGASTRVGELPDPRSRTVEAECEDFVKYAKALAKAKDAAEAKATYAKAKEALVAYLKGTKLESIGDPIYTSQ